MEHGFTEPTPARVAVVVADWEIECCGPPPVVGATTSWTLEFWPGSDPFLDEDLDWTVGHWDERITRLDRGVVAAYWAFGAGPPPAPGAARLRGRLQGTVHGGISPDGFPPCHGRVDRIRLLSQQYREAVPRQWEIVPDTVSAHEVAASPRWFGSPSMAAGVPRPFAVLLDITPGLPGDGPG